MEIRNTFSGYISEIDEIILLKRGSGIRDANSVIGKLNLHLHLISNNNYEDNNSLGESFLNYASEILGDTKKGLTGSQIVKYSNCYAWQYGIDIPITSSDFGEFGSKVPNKRTALYLNLCSFDAEQQFEIISELCDLTIFQKNKEVNGLKKALYNNFRKFSRDNIKESELVVRTEHWLSDYPEALKHYYSAIEKYERQEYKRNTLDDMRLSFELLLKSILKNGRSLENQISEVGIKLKDNGISKEIRNLIIKVIEYYTKFQNENVKHNDRINGKEIEYVIEQTSILMKFLIKVLTDNC